jgi:DNA-binding MarR family transcriptional regulator
MSSERDSQVLNDFLGSAQIFTSAVNDLMVGELKEAIGDDVTYPQIKLLKMVSLTEGYTVSNVAQFLGVSTAAASRAVERLVRRGLVNRAEAAEDRRAVRLSPTSKGQSVLAEYQRASSKALQAVFGHLSCEQLQQTGDLLDRLSVSIVERADGAEEVCFRCGIHFRDRCLLRRNENLSCFFHLHQRRSGGVGDDGKTGDGGRRTK